MNARSIDSIYDSKAMSMMAKMELVEVYGVNPDYITNDQLDRLSAAIVNTFGQISWWALRFHFFHLAARFSRENILIDAELTKDKRSYKISVKMDHVGFQFCNNARP